MFKLFGRKKEAAEKKDVVKQYDRSGMEMLKDLEGKPYKFYRGKSYDPIASGRFFCSCFDAAKGYSVSDEMPVYETEILVKNPLVIDATTETGYSLWNYLYVSDRTLYLREPDGHNPLSTDEVLKFAKRTGDFDAVIIKNVKEEIGKLPIYDIMVWDEKNLVNTRNVANATEEFETFRENTLKRVDLSAYIIEKEKDGVVSAIRGDGYFIEYTIRRTDTEWGIGHELVVNTDVPIEVYCIDADRYVVAEQEEPGIYKNAVYKSAAGMAPEGTFIPFDGIVRIKGIMSQCKHRIEKKKM